MIDEADFPEQPDAQSVCFTRRVPGPIERVWSYLVESDRRAQWLAAGDMKAEIGAPFELLFHHADLSPHQAPIPERFRAIEHGHRSEHRVTRFEPPHVLGFTWSDGMDGGPSEVLIELTDEGDHVKLVLTHRQLGTPDARRSVTGGWHVHLEVLRERLNGRTPPAFWTLFGTIDAAYGQRSAR